MKEKLLELLKRKIPLIENLDDIYHEIENDVIKIRVKINYGELSYVRIELYDYICKDMDTNEIIYPIIRNSYMIALDECIMLSYKELNEINVIVKDTKDALIEEQKREFQLYLDRNF